MPPLPASLEAVKLKRSIAQPEPGPRNRSDAMEPCPVSVPAQAALRNSALDRMNVASSISNHPVTGPSATFEHCQCLFLLVGTDMIVRNAVPQRMREIFAILVRQDPEELWRNAGRKITHRIAVVANESIREQGIEYSEESTEAERKKALPVVRARLEQLWREEMAMARAAAVSAPLPPRRDPRTHYRDPLTHFSAALKEFMEVAAAEEAAIAAREADRENLEEWFPCRLSWEGRLPRVSVVMVRRKIKPAGGSCMWCYAVGRRCVHREMRCREQWKWQEVRVRAGSRIRGSQIPGDYKRQVKDRMYVYFERE